MRIDSCDLSTKTIFGAEARSRQLLSVLALIVLISLQAVASAQADVLSQQEARDGVNEFIKTHPEVSFSVRRCGWGVLAPEAYVDVGVPRGTHLHEDKIAREVVDQGRNYAIANCDLLVRFGQQPSAQYGSYKALTVQVFYGTASERPSRDDVLVVGTYGQYNLQPKHYENRALERLRREQAALTEKKRQEEAGELFKAFVTKYRVANVVSCASLTTNPYAFEKKIVAVYAAFHGMVARDKAIFSSGECALAASSVPQGMFSTQRWYVLIAGEVLGVTENKVTPLLAAQIPHLTFVGVYICQQQECRDIRPGR